MALFGQVVDPGQREQPEHRRWAAGAGEQVRGGDWATNADARFPSQNLGRPSHLVHRDLLSPLKDIFPFSFSTVCPLILSPSVTMMIAAEPGENTTA